MRVTTEVAQAAERTPRLTTAPSHRPLLSLLCKCACCLPLSADPCCRARQPLSLGALSPCWGLDPQNQARHEDPLCAGMFGAPVTPPRLPWLAAGLRCVWARAGWSWRPPHTQGGRPESQVSLPPPDAHGWPDRCPDSRKTPKVLAPPITWPEKGRPARTPFPKLL